MLLDIRSHCKQGTADGKRRKTTRQRSIYYLNESRTKFARSESIMISSVGWVPRNVLKSKPVRANVTKQDLERLQQRLEVTMHQPDGFTEAESEADVMEIDEERTSAIRFAENTARHFVGTLGQRDRREVDPELEAAMNELNFDTYDSDGNRISLDFSSKNR